MTVTETIFLSLSQYDRALKRRRKDEDEAVATAQSAIERRKTRRRRVTLRTERFFSLFYSSSFLVCYGSGKEDDLYHNYLHLYLRYFSLKNVKIKLWMENLLR